jgi:hypothetical protein
VSQKQTSEQSDHEHVSKVLKDESRTSEDGKKVYWVTTLYGCTKCDATSTEGWFYEAEGPVDHTNCGGPDVCFGCKVQGIQLNTGDAGRDISDKKWNDRLAFYRKARQDGIQPNGTHPIQVEAAYKASETLGTAYNADTMVRADKVNNGVKEVMKEIGDI